MEANRSQTSQSLKQKAEALQSYAATGSLSSSISRVSGSSRGIPSETDFHFYYNFGEFKDPVREIAQKSKAMLDSIGGSPHLWGGKDMSFPDDFDDAYDWLVNVNDEVLERYDASVDEFRRARKADEENGFQLVCGRKKRGVGQSVERDGVDDSSNSAVKVASRDKIIMVTKPKVPFHIATIPRPQDEFKILVNNSNQPFEHVWLQRSEDGSRVIHPLEKLSVLDFVVVGDIEPVKPPPLESTPFKLVEEVKDLKALAAKLRGVNEFAVDLEHNHYRSFQGLTCLMQVSTRTEDFVVDTLKLRVHVGPYLREVFKDPTKRKVMHGADRDIVWLQRDFGIYVCNLFDTGQASRVLKLERNSLEYLLHYFCGVTANKEYQNADWRLRPLPAEMVRYAREDTHYLLHIYDLMRIRLLSTPFDFENSDSPLIEVYKKSYDICMQLYEKELLTESSYLYIYGLPGADLNAQQLAIVAGLCEWRDVVARAEDESTGYILPNRTLLEIAKQMPLTASKLRRLLRSKHPYVERNLNAVVSIIRHSIQNASAFEAAAEHLKEARMETVAEEDIVVTDVSENLPPSEAPETSHTSAGMEGTVGDNMTHTTISPSSMHSEEEPLELGSSLAKNSTVKIETESHITGFPGESLAISVKIEEPNTNTHASQSVTGATVQVLKKPSRAFGALLGSSATKRKFDPNKKEKEEIKLEQIKSSVNLPFHTFSGMEEHLQPAAKDAPKRAESLDHKPLAEPNATSNLEDIISLDGVSEVANEQSEHREDTAPGTVLEIDDENDDMSLSDLSSSFQKCFQSLNQPGKTRQVQKSQESNGVFQLKPFDYEAARNEVKFGEDRERGLGDEGDAGQRPKKGNKKNNLAVGRIRREEESGDFAQGRRRQAFPSSGNRSATFR